MKIENTGLVNTTSGLKAKRCTCSLYMTEQCNLKCIYCYEHIKRDKVLPFEVAKDAIISTFKRAREENVEYVEILFHGGEPFLAFDMIKKICEWLWSREWSCKYICFATTNGTLVHGEIKEWLLKNKDKFIAGLSLDGTPKMHNCNRSNSYHKIDIDFFCKTWPSQGVKMTPSPDTIESLAEGVIHIHNLGFTRNNCSFASGVDWTHKADGTPINYKGILLEQFKKLGEYYLANPELIPVDMLNIRFASVAAGKKAMKTKLCGAGTIMRCWTPDGQCLPCHLFYEYCKDSNNKLPELHLDKIEDLSDPKCKDCILEPTCPTCYGGNFITNGDVRVRDIQTCEIMKLRALVGSWMMGQMLESPEKYAVLRGLSQEQLSSIVWGIVDIQKNFQIQELGS